MNNFEEVNFLPDGYVNRKSRRRIVLVGVGLSVAVLTSLGIGTYRSLTMLRSAEQRQAAAVGEYDKAAERGQALARQRETQAKIIRQALSTASLLDWVPRSNVLAELTNSLPGETSLQELTLESRPRVPTTPAEMTAFDQKKAALKGGDPAKSVEVAPSDLTVKITGIADTDEEVAGYLSRLNKSQLLKDVSLVISEAYAPPGTKTPMQRRFQIQAMLKPDARLTTRPTGGDAIMADSKD